MSKIFVGFLLISFGINIGSFDFLPDFVGYFLIYLGMKELTDESPRFQKHAPLAVVLAVYELVVLLSGIAGSGSSGFGITSVLGLVSMAVSLYLTWQLVKGVQDIEIGRSCDLEGLALEKGWTARAVCMVLSFLLVWIPAVNVLAILLAFIAHIYFLVKLYQSKRSRLDK